MASCTTTWDDLDTPIENVPLARWERKRKEQLDKKCKTPNKTPQVSFVCVLRDCMSIVGECFRETVLYRIVTL